MVLHNLWSKWLKHNNRVTAREKNVPKNFTGSVYSGHCAFLGGKLMGKKIPIRRKRFNSNFPKACMPTSKKTRRTESSCELASSWPCITGLALFIRTRLVGGSRAASEEGSLQRGGEGLDEGGAGDDVGGGNNVLHARVLLLGQEPASKYPYWARRSIRKPTIQWVRYIGYFKTLPVSWIWFREDLILLATSGSKSKTKNLFLLNIPCTLHFQKGKLDVNSKPVPCTILNIYKK